MLKGATELARQYALAEYEKVITIADEILELNKNDQDAIFFKGQALLTRGEKNDYPIARQYFELLPKSLLATCYAGFAYLLDNNSDDVKGAAVTNFSGCIKTIKALSTTDQNKDYLEFCYKLAVLGNDLYFYKEDYPVVIQQLEAYEKEQSKLSAYQCELLFWQGVYLRLNNEPANALRCFGLILKTMPNNAHARIQIKKVAKESLSGERRSPNLEQIKEDDESETLLATQTKKSNEEVWLKAPPSPPRLLLSDIITNSAAPVVASVNKQAALPEPIASPTVGPEPSPPLEKKKSVSKLKINHNETNKMPDSGETQHSGMCCVIL